MTNKDLLKPFPFTVHCLMWGIYLAWIAWGNIVRYGRNHFHVLLLTAPLMISLVYLHRHGFRKLFIDRREWGKVFFWLCLSVIIVGSSIYMVLYRRAIGISETLLPNPEDQQFRDYLLDFIAFYWRFATAGVVLAAMEVFVNLLQDRLHALQQKKQDSSIRQNRQKITHWINHFSGNIANGTLYAVRKEVCPQQVAAAVAVNGYIVRLLAREQMFWVSLEEELYYLRRLREIFTAFPIQFDVSVQTYRHEVLPLSLLSLYKNICKHGDFETDTDSASFYLAASPDRLLVVTQNRIMPDAMWIYQEGGSGLEQLKGLLSANHGESVRLDYGLEGDRFLLRLEIRYDIA